MRKIDREAIIMPGVRKSGTTSLHNLLIKHSNTSKSVTKEPRFFILPEDEIKKRLDWYKENYLEEDKILMDASMRYFRDKTVPEKIKKFFKKEPKIIIILRDPAKRIYSNYYFVNKHAYELDKRSFDQILEMVKGPEYEKIIRTEKEALQKAVDNNKINLSVYKKIMEDWNENLKKEKDRLPHINFPKEFPEIYREMIKWKVEHFTTSLYSNFIPLWKDNFKHVKVIFFEELINERDKVVRELLDFLDLEYKKLELPHANETFIPTSSGREIKKFAKKYLPIQLIKLFKDIIPNNLIDKPRPEMTREQYKKTRRILKKEYEYWFKKHPRVKKYWKY